MTLRSDLIPYDVFSASLRAQRRLPKSDTGHKIHAAGPLAMLVAATAFVLAKGESCSQLELLQSAAFLTIGRPGDVSELGAFLFRWLGGCAAVCRAGVVGAI